MDNKHKVVASCENRNCSLNNLIEVIDSINIECALETANKLNTFKAQKCTCGHHLTYFPFTIEIDNYNDYFEEY